jgi:hypothetical protein
MSKVLRGTSFNTAFLQVSASALVAQVAAFQNRFSIFFFNIYFQLGALLCLTLSKRVIVHCTITHLSQQKSELMAGEKMTRFTGQKVFWSSSVCAAKRKTG